MTPVHFVVNALAMGGTDRLATLRAEALRRFPDGRWMPTRGPGDAAQLARAAACDGAELVVAVGGDGTINEVVNGLMTAGTGRVPTLGILPAGSGSDFVRTIGIGRATALDILVAGRSRVVDVGEIVCAPLDAQAAGPARRYFMNIAGCGSSGRVVQRFNQRTLPGTLGYAVAAARTALDYRFPRVAISADGGPFEEVLLTLIFVCNGAYCGGGMHVGKAARVDDGLLHVAAVCGVGRVRSILQWPRLYTGSLEKVRGARVHVVRRLKITSHEDVLVDCDGELAGRLPAEFSLRPAAIHVICA